MLLDSPTAQLPSAAGMTAEGTSRMSADRAAASTLSEFLAGINVRAYRFAEASLRNRDDALDAVQEAMSRMLGYADRPAAEWTPLFWTVLRSRIIDIRRRDRFRLRWLLPQDPQSPEAAVAWDEHTPEPARAAASRQAWQHLADALRTLPTRQREAFTLRVLEELDVADTARAMGCSEGSVKTHLSRARTALQQRMKEWQ